MTMTTLNETIAKHGYAATEQQVESLAAQHAKDAEGARQSDSTYLKVFIARCQADMGRTRRGRQPAVDAQLAIVDKVNGILYAAVMRGVVDPSIEAAPTDAPDVARAKALERNRRSAFARSTASTVRSYAAAGGDLRGINLADVTKGALRAALAPPEPPDKGDRQVARAQGALLRAVSRIAKRDAEHARELLEAAAEAIEFALEGIGKEPAAAQPQPDLGATTAVPGVRGPTTRTRVGVPQLHRSA